MNSALPEWDGNEQTWGRHKRKIRGFKRSNKKDYMDGKFWAMPNPSKRARVTTARDATADDPTGAAEGTRLARESVEQYEEKCEQYDECNQGWFDVLGASLVGGKAEAKVEEMTEDKQTDGKMLEAALESIYEGKSTKNLAGLYLSWITTPKRQDQTTEEFVKEWNTTRKTIEKNMDWKTMRIMIFMKLLQDKPFYNIETSKSEKLDLETVQQRAEDWDRDQRRDSDEASVRSTQIAFSATSTQQRQRGTARVSNNNDGNGGQGNHLNHEQKKQRPCAACGHDLHCWYRCFDGGLSWMSEEQKEAYLQERRDRRRRKQHQQDNRKNKNTSNHINGNAEKPEQALAAQQLQHEAALTRVKSVLESKMLHGVVGELEDVLG